MYKSSLFLLVFCYGVSAQLSPGDLSRPHAGLEGLTNCRKCHAMEQQISADKCLDCHTLLGEKIKSGSGLHATSGYDKCQTCHAEHNGRDFELIWWPDGMEKFDHAKTGYVLQGKHTQLTCRQCHRAENIQEKNRYESSKKDLKRTFLGLSEKCLSCHQDHHKGQFDKTCETCHALSQWKPVQSFDHQKTGFPLTGGHQTVTCTKCHPVNNKNEMHFRPIKHEVCIDCHRDPHQAKFGNRCEKCHTTTAWRGTVKKGFNHDMTRYPLRGKHQQVACEKCHQPNRPVKGLSFATCRSCHQDYHRGAFDDHSSKGVCESCHTIEGFAPSKFDIPEHQKSDYPLEGAHLAVPCIACHKNEVGPWRFSFKNRDCQVCHINPHGEEVRQLSLSKPEMGCAFCHGFESWMDVTFDHNKSGFRLEEKHNRIKCSSCHQRSEIGMLRFSGLKPDCKNCHTDVHRGQFRTADGIDCGKCHTAKDWLAEKFMHSRDSRFTIEGAHRYVTCEKCHPTEEENGVKFTRYKPLEITCASCHKDKKSMKE